MRKSLVETNLVKAFGIQVLKFYSFWPEERCLYYICNSLIPMIAVPENLTFSVLDIVNLYLQFQRLSRKAELRH